MATYLIGDIQGCYDPLQRLLEKLNFDPSEDRLWSCGDLVNRGGQSLEVLRLLASMGDRVTVTLGNHDLYLLADDSRFPHGNSRNHEFREVLKAADREALMNWLRHQPMAFKSAEHKLLMVHAGVVPQWAESDTLAYAAEVEQVLRSDQHHEFFLRMTKGKGRGWNPNKTGIERQRMIAAILTRIRFCDTHGKVLWDASGPPGSLPLPWRPWFRHPHRATREVFMVFGHWAALGLRIRNRFIALDSGCVWGGRLSAYRLEDQQLIQVPGQFKRASLYQR
ncbi:MAG: symmetrical bis(5'-nucleosyl)-tetraphosphatase [Xanthomonadales bacterium]|nr:symmetrical bis(5'-nucleosyl)-tetraphosphatase [Xanthomonadales bacterium]